VVFFKGTNLIIVKQAKFLFYFIGKVLNTSEMRNVKKYQHQSKKA